MGTKHWPRSGIVTALALALTTAGCTGGSTDATTSSAAPLSGTPAPPPSTRSAGDLQSAYIATIKKVLPSVVLIRTSRDLGSGVIYDAKGDIVTNDHVVGTATQFQVTLTGSAQPRTATLVGRYPVEDLAVIRVSGAKNLHPARFGDSSKVQVGDIVLAMGNPLGLASSVTNGIVSAVGRTVTEPAGEGSPGATLPDTIQTSAAINPGNSGGALANLAGEVIGIPTLAATDQQLGGAAPGIGFAISSNIVKDVADQLIAHGRVVVSHRAAINATVTTVLDDNGQPAGVGIVEIQPGGAADKAGLSAGEVITSLAGQPTPSTQALSTLLANLQPGKRVKVEVTRSDGSKKTVTVTLGRLNG